eukprot:Phypoly_transcript_26691.p1 GENE.Phypoly_transcript_26691~~Phypoly_transcript_26691.p1  ORF type:complete len:120 (+),score=12.65 Phypoly_transcript_26691:55-360(+)
METTKTGKPFSFELTARKIGKTYLIQATSKAEVDDWIRALEKVPVFFSFFFSFFFSSFFLFSFLFHFFLSFFFILSHVRGFVWGGCVYHSAANSPCVSAPR